MVQSIACGGASFFCVLSSCLCLCASQITSSPSVAAGDDHGVAETCVEALHCRAPLLGIGSVLLQKSSSRIELRQGAKKTSSIVNVSSSSPTNLSVVDVPAQAQAQAVAVEDGQRKHLRRARVAILLCVDKMRKSLLEMRTGVAVFLASFTVLCFLSLGVFCMMYPQEEKAAANGRHFFDPRLLPRRLESRKMRKVPLIPELPLPLPVDTLPFQALSSQLVFPPPTSFSPQFGSSSHSYLRQVERSGSVVDSVRSMRAPAPRIPIGSHSSLASSYSSQDPYRQPLQRQSIESHHLLSPWTGPPASLGGVVHQDLVPNSSRPSLACKPRFSTEATTRKFSTPPRSPSPRMSGPSPSTFAADQQVARWRAEIQARVAAATEEEVARRKMMARGGLLGGHRVAAPIARTSSPNRDAQLAMAPTQGQPQVAAEPQRASQLGLNGVSGLVTFFDSPRRPHGM